MRFHTFIVATITIAITSGVLQSATVPTSQPSQAQALKLSAVLDVTETTGEAGKPKEQKTLTLVLANVSASPITVVSGEALDLTLDDDRLFVGLDEVQSVDGFVLVESPAKLAPVTLRPGEAVSFTVNPEILQDVSSDKLTVVYRVRKFWADRLSIWGGETEAEAKIAKSGPNPHE